MPSSFDFFLVRVAVYLLFGKNLVALLQVSLVVTRTAWLSLISGLAEPFLFVSMVIIPSSLSNLVTVFHIAPTVVFLLFRQFCHRSFVVRSANP